MEQWCESCVSSFKSIEKQEWTLVTNYPVFVCVKCYKPSVLSMMLETLNWYNDWDLRVMGKMVNGGIVYWHPNYRSHQYGVIFGK
jgi:hypothetical protein